MAVSIPTQRSSSRRAPRRRRANDTAVRLTLLELVRTVGEITDDEAEIVATVVHLLRSGKVKLAGNFRDEPLSQLLD
jgi:hypothetical protein